MENYFHENICMFEKYRYSMEINLVHHEPDDQSSKKKSSKESS